MYDRATDRNGRARDRIKTPRLGGHTTPPPATVVVTPLQVHLCQLHNYLRFIIIIANFWLESLFSAALTRSLSISSPLAEITALFIAHAHRQQTPN